VSSVVGAPGLDMGSVGAWLVAAAGLHPPVRFARVGKGASNLTYLATDRDGRRVVLRRPPLGHLLPSAHDVAREHRVLRALGQTGVPSPRVVAFTEDATVTNAPLLVMEYVEGLVVDDVEVAAGLGVAVRARLGPALARALANVHAVDLGAVGLLDLASHKPYAARQLKRWRTQWAGSRTRELPGLVMLADRLEAAMPEQRELTLVHGDFHLLNTIVAPDGSDVRAVLDWELCTLGDPLADLGGLLAYWSQPEDVGVAFPASQLPGFSSRAEIVEEYLGASGRDASPVELAFWHALGLWKIAVIVEGVRRRALDEPRNTPDSGVPDARLVEDLVAQAQVIAFAAGL
jgi:aminoglycoside phosphotransferase (APT) family kinase protein